MCWRVRESNEYQLLQFKRNEYLCVLKCNDYLCGWLSNE